MSTYQPNQQFHLTYLLIRVMATFLTFRSKHCSFFLAQLLDLLPTIPFGWLTLNLAIVVAIVTDQGFLTDQQRKLNSPRARNSTPDR